MSPIPRRNSLLPLEVLPTLALGVAATLPLLIAGQLPQASDMDFHLYRILQLDTLFRNGIFYSRWAPDLVRGFGYPIFNYYAPLSYYGAELLHLLGFNLQFAVILTLVLAYSGMAFFTYRWLADHCRPDAALVGAATYVFSPYLIMNTFHRGVLPEIMALMWIPLVLWSLQRFMSTGRSRYGLSGAFAIAALNLSHNVTALIAMPFIAAYAGLLIFLTATRDRQRWLVTISRAGMPLVLGMGLAAFFWWPALAERHFVQTYRLTIWDVFNYRNNFIDLKKLLGMPVPIDPSAVNYAFLAPLGLSYFGAGLAFLGVFVVWNQRHEWRKAIIVSFISFYALLTLYMIIPLSQSLWDALPFLQLLQFPWRFLGLANLWLAFLAALGYQLLTSPWQHRRRITSLAAALFVLVSYAYIITWQYVPLYPATRELTLQAAMQQEHNSAAIGTTTTGEYLPFTVRELPPRDQVAYATDGSKLNQAALPADVQVQQVVARPLQHQIALEAATTFSLTLNIFDFPGWQATLDGKPVPIYSTDPYGLISVIVPPGHHEITVRFGSTPVRRLAGGLSILSLAALFILAVLNARLSSTISLPPPLFTSPPATWHVTTSVTALLLIGMGVKIGYIDTHDTFLRYHRLAGTTILHARYPVQANFDNRLRLLGAEAPATIKSDSPLDFTLYWQVVTETQIDYSIGAVLTNEQGLRVGVSDHQNPGDYPTRLWPATLYNIDQHHLALAPGLPPGTYTLNVSVYPYGQPEQTLNILNAAGMPSGRSLPAFTIQVTRPRRPATLAELAPSVVVQQSLGHGLALLGYDLPVTTVRTGERLPFTLDWQAEVAPGSDWQLAVNLIDGKGQIAMQTPISPVPGYPTSQWRPKDTWRGIHTLLLSPRLSSGLYTLTLGFPEGPIIPLGALTVTAPAHTFTAPTFAHLQTARFSDLATLLGYDLSPMPAPGTTLTLTLIWQANRETERSYKVFVHLMSTDGQLIAGSDATPAAWQRPTTGWVAGEYIVDRHELSLPVDLPTGHYVLEVGLYDEVTGIRLATPESDAVKLATEVTIQ